MRLIDADELKTAFPCGESVRTECVRETIDHMPTIQPEPERKKGRWIDDGDPLTFKCDKCGYLVARYNNTNFCPNCGSYNGGEQE